MYAKALTILLVEDDLNIQRTNRRILEREGFTALTAQTLAETRALLKQHSVDALVLDILMPDGSGLAFCEEIRSATAAPILFLTALDEKSEILEGLSAGGDDYITKPYDVDVFIARIKALLGLADRNRMALSKVQILSRGPLQLDTVALRAFLRGEDMLLSAREFSVLLLLFKNAGRTLSAEEIYRGAWNQPFSGNANALWKCMSRLKKKLAVVGDEVSLLTFRNKGYLLEIIE